MNTPEEEITAREVKHAMINKVYKDAGVPTLKEASKTIDKALDKFGTDEEPSAEELAYAMLGIGRAIQPLDNGPF